MLLHTCLLMYCYLSSLIQETSSSTVHRTANDWLMQARHWLAFHCEENGKTKTKHGNKYPRSVSFCCACVCFGHLWRRKKWQVWVLQFKAFPASSSHAAVDEWASSSCQVVEQKRTSLVFPSLFSDFWSWAQIPTNWSDKTSDSVNHRWFIQPELKASSVWINLHNLNWSLHFFDFLIRQTVLQILPSDALYQHHSALVY